MAQQLMPFEPPLGPLPPLENIYAPVPVTLRMKEKIMSFSGDEFYITTVDERPVLTCIGKVFSAHNKKVFADAATGRELFTLKKKLFALMATFEAVLPEGSELTNAQGSPLFEVRGHFSVGSSKSSVHFINHADRSQVELELKGDWLDRKADLTLNGRVVAHIDRDFFNAREMLGGKQTYFVTIAPGVDISMVAAVCVCLDERES